jgi:hypothetical protein
LKGSFSFYIKGKKENVECFIVQRDTDILLCIFNPNQKDPDEIKKELFVYLKYVCLLFDWIIQKYFVQCH